MTLYRKRPQKRLYPIIVALRAERDERKCPRKVVAYQMGCSESTLAKWELGTCLPSLQSLHDWCDAIGVKLEITRIGKP